MTMEEGYQDAMKGEVRPTSLLMLGYQLRVYCDLSGKTPPTDLQDDRLYQVTPGSIQEAE